MEVKENGKYENEEKHPKDVSTDGIRLEGFIDIEIVNEAEHYTKRYHNTITKGGKQLILAHSIAPLLNMSASMFGNGVIINNGFDDSKSKNSKLTNYLLNLGSTAQAKLNENTSYIPFKGNIVGSANNQIAPNKDGKTGSINYCKGEYCVDGYTIAERWEYGLGVASGTIDTIVMAFDTKQPLISFFKCLDKVNLQNVNYVSSTKEICIPGIPGYTADNEILLNFNQDGVGTHKYNMTTGEITDNPLKFKDIGGPCFPVELGNYIYIKNKVYNKTDMSYKTMSINYDFMTIFKDKTGGLWLCSSDVYKGSDTILYKINTGVDGSYISLVEPTTNDLSRIITLPEGVLAKNIMVGSIGSNYYLCEKVDSYVESNRTYICLDTYLFSDTTDIYGSILDVIGKICPGTICYKTATSYGTLEKYFSPSIHDPTINDATNIYRKVVNNTSSKYITAEGAYISQQGWSTNALSFVKLTTPIVKQDTDIMYVSYGYKIV